MRRRCVYIYIMQKKQLHGYQLQIKDNITKIFTIDLHMEGPYALHVIDNLLVAHNLRHKISMIFDIKEAECFVASPLPLSSPPYLIPDDICMFPYNNSNDDYNQ